MNYIDEELFQNIKKNHKQWQTIMDKIEFSLTKLFNLKIWTDEIFDSFVQKVKNQDELFKNECLNFIKEKNNFFEQNKNKIKSLFLNNKLTQIEIYEKVEAIVYNVKEFFLNKYKYFQLFTYKNYIIENESYKSSSNFQKKEFKTNNFFSFINSESTPQQILGVSKNATSDEIKKAYIRLSKIYHPDFNKENSSEEMMRLINSAYDQLKDK